MILIGFILFILLLMLIAFFFMVNLILAYGIKGIILVVCLIILAVLLFDKFFEVDL